MLILPTVEFPPVTPFIFQTTFVFAVNCRVWRIFTLALVGETVTVIDGAVTAMLTAFDTWPPGFVTVMGMALLMEEAEPVAVSFNEVKYVVVRAVPFHFTTAPFWKALPFMVKVKLPTVTGLGVTDEIAGAGAGV